MKLQVSYVGSQGHRLLATHDINFGNPQTCLDLNNIVKSHGGCEPRLRAVLRRQLLQFAAGEIPAGVTLHMPYGPQADGDRAGSNADHFGRSAPILLS